MATGDLHPRFGGYVMTAPKRRFVYVAFIARVVDGPGRTMTPLSSKFDATYPQGVM